MQINFNDMSDTVPNDSGEPPKEDSTKTNNNAPADETKDRPDGNVQQQVDHELVYEPFENSLAVFKNNSDGRYGLSFRKSAKIFYFPAEQDAYKMLKSVLVHFGERKDSDDSILPPQLHDLPMYSIDEIEQKGLIKLFEDSFGMHWSDIPSMRFKKHDYRRQLKEEHDRLSRIRTEKEEQMNNTQMSLPMKRAFIQNRQEEDVALRNKKIKVDEVPINDPEALREYNDKQDPKFNMEKDELYQFILGMSDGTSALRVKDYRHLNMQIKNNVPEFLKKYSSSSCVVRRPDNSHIDILWGLQENSTNSKIT